MSGTPTAYVQGEKKKLRRWSDKIMCLGCGKQLKNQFAHCDCDEKEKEDDQDTE